MKILIFGNLASGKSFLARKLEKKLYYRFEYLAIDNFRKKMGDGSMSKEIESKNKFFDSIVENKNQIIEASGFGDTGINIYEKIKNTQEFKLLILLKTPQEICIERLKNRTWNIPYPAPYTKAFTLVDEINKMIEEEIIENKWKLSKHCKIVVVKNNPKDIFQKILNFIYASI